ncbi:hypothetical protein [Actinoplanes sp. NPDC020271]|uniref:hypothetical protein n=1 Tax=Actinoplanes sp. NPDC020271 TaxID=3363896 RepID=UPI0037B22C10
MRRLRPPAAAATAAAVGYVLVWFGVSVLLAMQDRVDWGIYDLTIFVGYLVGLPLVGWALLGLLRVRPAWPVAFLAPVVLVVLLDVVQPFSGDHVAMANALLAAAAYAVSAAAVTVVAEWFKRRFG